MDNCLCTKHSQRVLLSVGEGYQKYVLGFRDACGTYHIRQGSCCGTDGSLVDPTRDEHRGYPNRQETCSETDGSSVDPTLQQFAASFATSHSRSTPATDLISEAESSIVPLSSMGETSSHSLERFRANELLFQHMTKEPQNPFRNEMLGKHHDPREYDRLYKGWSDFCGPFLNFWHLVEVVEVCERIYSAKIARRKTRRRLKRKFEAMTKSPDTDDSYDFWDRDIDCKEIMLVDSWWRAILKDLSEEYAGLAKCQRGTPSSQK